jgi:hypothetical protein
MKQTIKFFLFFLVTLTFQSLINKGYAQATMQEDADTNYTESVTVVDTASSDAKINAENSVKNYAGTEEIHYYSGKQDGNNVIKKIEVPLPEGNERRGVYIPH